MIGIDDRYPNLECEVCDDYDHCLPRWEDDGGDTARRPPLARAYEKEYEDDHEYRDRPPDERRHQPA